MTFTCFLSGSKSVVQQERDDLKPVQRRVSLSEPNQYPICLRKATFRKGLLLFLGQACINDN